MENSLQKSENNQLVKTFDLAGKLPNLHTEAKELPIDLSSSYWTPEKIGEFRRGFYQRIEIATYVNQTTGEEIQLPCVIMVAQDEKGDVTTIRNGSKRLVASIEEAVNDGRISVGMPLQITFLGEEKNKTNGYKSARWSVKPLIVN
jgi:hypothetical protein